MTIDQLLTNSRTQFSLDLFSSTSIKAIDSVLTERNGKYYLKCRLRGKEVIAKSEEIIRQLWLY